MSQEDSLEAQIERVCEEYELQWMTNRSPRIEDFLTEWSGLDRSSLFRELIRIEAVLLQRSGQSLDKSEYQRRFPDLIEVVDGITELDDGPTTIHVADSPGDTVVWSPTSPNAPGGSSTRDDGIRFMVLRPHAKGGLGQVSLARDEELRREVALKEIQPQFADNEQYRARFLLEAEITGCLEHPGIVPVYGLGQFPENGRPFYAMRFVKGDSLEEATNKFHKGGPDSHSPAFGSAGFRKLLRHFVDVCQTIEYAHSRGVLHRDLKPGNIMLGSYGETLVVDWGLAKVTSQEESGQAIKETQLKPTLAGHVETVMGSVFGTPGYMPPEQAEGKLDELSEASDVYSLGGTLYYMLTCRSPRGAELTPLRSVNSDIPKPLQAICQKAMAQAGSDRYSSPAELGEEIERWLADDPVHAHRDSLYVRLRRWIRRHQKLATGTAAAILVGVVSLAVGVSLLAAKNTELNQANGRSRERFELALRAIEKYHKGVSEDVLLKQPDLADLRKRLLNSALEFYRELEPTLTGATDAVSRYDLGRAYEAIARITTSVGDYQQGIIAFQRSFEVFQQLTRDHPDNLSYSQRLVESCGNLGRAQHLSGKSKASAKTFELTLQLQQKFAAKHGDDSHVQDVLAQVYINTAGLQAERGEVTEAVQSLMRGLDIQKKLIAKNPTDSKYNRTLASAYSNLGALYQRTINNAAALNAYQQALIAQEKLVKEYGQVVEYGSDLAGIHVELGVVRTKMGDHKTALSSFQLALEIYEELTNHLPTVTEYQSGLARACAEIGRTQQLLRDPAGAEESYTRVLSILEPLASKHPAAPQFRRELAGAYFALGVLHRDSGAKRKAADTIRRSVDLRQKLSLDEPLVIVHKADAARAQSLLGSLLIDAAKTREEGMKLLRQAKKLQVMLVAENRLIRNYRIDLAITHGFLGEAQRSLGDSNSARASFQQALAINKQLLVNDGPKNPEYLDNLAQAYTKLGVFEGSRGDFEQAVKLIQRSLKIRLQLFSGHSEVLDYQDRLAEAYTNLGVVQSETTSPLEGLKSHKLAVKIRNKLDAENPNVPRWQTGLGKSLSSLGVLQAQLGRRRAARQSLDRSRQINRDLVTKYPRVPEYQEFLASSCFNLGRLTESTEPANAVQQYQESAGLLEKLISKGLESTNVRHLLAKNYNNLGRILGRTEKATELFRRAYNLRKKLVVENPGDPVHATELGGICCNLARTYRSSDTAKSLSWYTKAIGTLRGVKVPNANRQRTTVRQFLFTSHLGRALLLVQLKRHKDAVSDWSAAIEFDRGPLRKKLRLNQCLARVNAGDYRRAVEEAKTLAKEQIPVPMLYNVACVYSLVSRAAVNDSTRPKSERTKSSEAYASKAVATLSRARTLGYFSKSSEVEYLKKDSDLNPIRNRKDFKKLLKELDDER